MDSQTLKTDLRPRTVNPSRVRFSEFRILVYLRSTASQPSFSVKRVRVCAESSQTNYLHAFLNVGGQNAIVFWGRRSSGLSGRSTSENR